MNLNDCINRLPLILRGRFSSSNNASWLSWAADCMAQIERVSSGPGMLRTVQAKQLSSGFIPKPKSLFTINNAWLDGEPVQEVKFKDSRGFPMTYGSVKWESHSVSIEATDEFTASVSVKDSASEGSIPEPLVVTVIYAISNTKKVSIVPESGSFPSGVSSLAGASLWINGSQVVITWNSNPSDTSNGSCIADVDVAPPNVTDLAGQILEWYPSGALDGCEVYANGELVQIASSSWDRPVTSPVGWSNARLFTCDRAAPGRSWAGFLDGELIKSNLTVEGYRSLARPTSMTEELDLPPGSEGLVSAYLRWAAENDQDISSSEAAVARKAFEMALRQYAIDQSRTEGTSRVSFYQFTPSLTGRRP